MPSTCAEGMYLLAQLSVEFRIIKEFFGPSFNSTSWNICDTSLTHHQQVPEVQSNRVHTYSCLWRAAV
eukprot:355896-Chlamydomonas_euryale.AAC.1